MCRFTRTARECPSSVIISRGCILLLSRLVATLTCIVRLYLSVLIMKCFVLLVNREEEVDIFLSLPSLLPLSMLKCNLDT